MGAVAWEAIVRLEHPTHVEGQTVVWLAALGIVVNAVTAFLFFSGRKEDLNVRGAFLHLAADAVISVGVVLSGFAIIWTHQLWIDPVMSLVIVAAIVYGTWGLFKESLNLSLQAVPENIDREGVEGYLKRLPGVVSLHDLHIWGMSTSQVALTVHLVMRPAKVDDAFLARIGEELHHKFGIEHPTIQIETGNGPECTLAPDEHV